MNLVPKWFSLTFVQVAATALLLGVPNRSTADTPPDSTAVQLWAGRVIAAAGLIEDPRQKLVVQTDLAKVYRHTGQPIKAYEAALQASKSNRRGLQMAAARHAVIALQSAGMESKIDDVLDIARRANERGILTYGLMDVFLYAGRPELAIELAEQKPIDSRYQTLLNLLCKHQNYELADELLQSKFKTQSKRDQLLVGMVKCVAREHAVNEAKRLADQIRSSSRRMEANLALASETNSNEDLGRNLDRILRMERRRLKSEEALKLALQLVELDRLDDAAKVIQSAIDTINEHPADDQTSKFGTYGDASAIAKLRIANYALAKAFADRGDDDAASDQFEIADVAYKRLRPEAALVRWTVEMARVSALLHLDRIEEAERMLEEAVGEHSKNQFLKALAVYAVKHDDLNQAVLYGERIPPGNHQRKDVAVALMEFGSQHVAPAFFDDLELDDQVDVISRLGRKAAKSATPKELEEIFRTLEKPDYQCHFASEILASLVEKKPSSPAP